MIDIFDPLKYEFTQPPSDEILLILDSPIEKYVITELTRENFIALAEGFFRLQSRRKETAHNGYVSKKTREIYEYVKHLDLDSGLIRIDYSMRSVLMVSVYVETISKKMIGGIKGYRLDAMTEDEYRELWYGSISAGSLNLRDASSQVE
jgi:hypothetical protein